MNLCVDGRAAAYQLLTTAIFTQGLQIAACLGPTFDAKTFEMADSNSGLHVVDFLYIVTGSGFIQPQDSNPGHYAWAHDRIR